MTSLGWLIKFKWGLYVRYYALRLSSLNLFVCTVVMQKNILVFKKKGKKEDAERWAPESLESCLKPRPSRSHPALLWLRAVPRWNSRKWGWQKVLSKRSGIGGLAGHFPPETRINFEFPHHSSPSPGRLDNWHRNEKEINTSPSTFSASLSGMVLGCCLWSRNLRGQVRSLELQA